MFLHAEDCSYDHGCNIVQSPATYVTVLSITL